MNACWACREALLAEAEARSKETDEYRRKTERQIQTLEVRDARYLEAGGQSQATGSAVHVSGNYIQACGRWAGYGWGKVLSGGSRVACVCGGGR